jgi:NADH-quinone oxidoreductase subunit A
MSAPSPYVGLAVHVALCVALGAGLLVAGALLRVRVARRPRDREETYECGEVPFGSAWTRVPVGFYRVALLFILFDVEAAFLFLWVASLRDVGMAAFWAMTAFLAVLLLGWAYALRKGDLTWSR